MTYTSMGSLLRAVIRNQRKDVEIAGTIGRGRPQIAIDFHNVIADWHRAAMQLVWERTGRVVKERAWGGVKEASQECYEFCLLDHNFLELLEPVDEAVKYLPLLAKDNDLHLVTSTGAGTEITVLKWLRWRGMEGLFKSIHFVGSDGRKDILCNAMGYHALLDDSPAVLQRFKPDSPCIPIAYTKPYNLHVNVMGVDNWAQFHDMINHAGDLARKADEETARSFKTFLREMVGVALSNRAYAFERGRDLEGFKNMVNEVIEERVNAE